MTDEVFNLMKCFPRSKIIYSGELILDSKGNVFFKVKGLETKKEIIYKMLEWVSRPIVKGCPYASNKNNIMWRRSLLLGFNNYLKTNFALEDIWVIYERLGNSINHELTVEFVESNFDMKILNLKEGVNNGKNK